MEIMNHTKKNGASTLAGKYKHFTEDIQEALLENKKALLKLQKATVEAVGEAEETLQDAAHDMQHKVKKNPWKYIGAAAGCGLLLGFILGKKK